MTRSTSAAEADDLLDLLPCGLLQLSADLEILSANAYFLDLIGASPADLEGMKLHRLLSVAGRIFLQTRLQQELALAGRLEELALDIIRTDGVRVPVMLNAVQPPDAHGQPGPIRIALWRAVSKRAYEAEVPKARLAAQEAVQVKADFLANVSHEIRTPLNGVIAVAGVLRRTPLTSEQQEMVDMIQSSGAMLERLVSDILDLSKVQAGGLTLEARPFDLMDEIGGVIDMARLRAREKGIGFHLDCGEGVEGRYLGDSVRLKQILGNLTANAIKFTEQGEVRLALARTADGRIELQVSDTGVGFDEEVGDTLFRRFQQADSGITRRFGGTGLGLSITKALVDLMGGTITARSRPGEGSHFTATLPLPQIETVLAPSREAPPPAPTDVSASPRILLVEDNPTNQRVVQMILAPFDIDLTMVENGALGVEAWRRGAFDLVLMDMQMPVMDGLTAIAEIRRIEQVEPHRGRTPVAMLSANAMEHHRQESIRAGADLHLSKPITPERLLAGIEQALALAAAPVGSPIETGQATA
ncbi:PAS domain-containing hybrid sensor histidine kinase/response regulator [Phenylobacterium sp.]|uniref:PAS domain-containing hybrid sensor histidine kinase/response regulator n=1 Tax=Phenylobacterium sp. TaxID=1871053 RepID=UPI00272FD548|nr:PAS domain-containing hybrid sensor histidine kinase/response regulator [Phenylobacterium sp.]MDP1616846.1 ATP-binding protein [Phenylobacterium sp.]MDP1987566.1 ATP-binding protein [Phenylobacterium sp.]